MAGSPNAASAPRGVTFASWIMRSTVKAVAVAAAVLVSLTACDKPKPEVTVFSGANSIHVAANCWTEDGSNAVGTPGCSSTEIGALVTNGQEASLTVAPGSTLGISVDTDVANAGWAPSLLINGQTQPLTTGVLHRRYWKMVYPETAASSLMGTPLTLQIITQGASANVLRGLWIIKLSPSENLNNA